MVLISSTLAVGALLVIVVLALLVAWWKQNYQSYDQDSIHTFIAVLTGLGVFITFLFYYNLIQLQEQQQELTAIQEASTISDTTVNGVLEAMNTASTIIPAFVLSLTPLTNTTCCPGGETGGTACTYTPAEDPVTPQTCTEKMTLSYRIFSLWQDVLMSNGYLQSNHESYLANFLQRANSQSLYQQWLTNRLNFAQSSQTFGDLLFEYGLPITVQTPASYIEASNRLLADPRYQSLTK